MLGPFRTAVASELIELSSVIADIYDAAIEILDPVLLDPEEPIDNWSI